jgi:hypothetical protein
MANIRNDAVTRMMNTSGAIMGYPIHKKFAKVFDGSMYTEKIRNMKLENAQLQKKILKVISITISEF